MADEGGRKKRSSSCPVGKVPTVIQKRKRKKRGKRKGGRDMKGKRTLSCIRGSELTCSGKSKERRYRKGGKGGETMRLGNMSKGGKKGEFRMVWGTKTAPDIKKNENKRGKQRWGTIEIISWKRKFIIPEEKKGANWFYGGGLTAQGGKALLGSKPGGKPDDEMWGEVRLRPKIKVR